MTDVEIEALRDDIEASWACCEVELDDGRVLYPQVQEVSVTARK